MPNLDNSELIHAAGNSWKNYKYVKKIGNRYFYTMDEYDAFNSRTKSSRMRNSPYYENQVVGPGERRRYPNTVRKASSKTTGTIGSTGSFKKKQSIGEAFTSGIKSAGKKISDATGETERKRAEAAEQLSGILAKKTASSKKELDAASQNWKMANLSARQMREKAQLYEDEAAVSKAASDYKSYSRAAANDKKIANTETEEAKKYRKMADEYEKAASAYTGDGKDASRAGTLKRTAETLRRMADESDSKNREQYTESAKKNEKMAEESKSKVDALTSEAEKWRLKADNLDNTFTAQYSRDVAFARMKYEKDLKAYEAVLSEAQAYREKYGNTVSGKLEKAANDVQRAYNDVVQSASEAIDAGKQFAKETANKVSIGVSELATKASDTVASGLAWVESVFAPKKKK